MYVVWCGYYSVLCLWEDKRKVMKRSIYKYRYGRKQDHIWGERGKEINQLMKHCNNVNQICCWSPKYT